MEYTLNTSIAEDTSTIQKAIEQIADNEAADSKADGHGQLPENPSREIGVPVSSGQKASVHHWFFTFMWINIPVIGWFYLFYLAFNRKNTSRRNFARAYLLYKLLSVLLSAALLAALVYVGIQVADKVLAYMEML